MSEITAGIKAGRYHQGTLRWVLHMQCYICCCSWAHAVGASSVVCRCVCRQARAAIGCVAFDRTCRVISACAQHVPAST